MKAIEQNQGSDSIRPAQVRLEEAAIAILIERIASLDQETKDDLMAVFMEIPQCDSCEELEEIGTTMRELLYPALAGNLITGLAGSAESTRELKDWSRKMGARIKNLREQKGMNQTDLAEASGLTQSHVSRLENGAHSPSHKTVRALSSALGVDVKKIDPGAED